MFWVSGQNFKKCEFFTNGQLLEVESQFWNYWSLFLASEVLPLASSYKMFYHLPPIGKLFEIYHLPPIIAQSYKSLDFFTTKRTWIKNHFQMDSHPFITWLIKCELILMVSHSYFLGSFTELQALSLTSTSQEMPRKIKIIWNSNLNWKE